MSKKRVTTRNLNPDENCQICGGCDRCQHYHVLRFEVRDLRRALRELVKISETVARSVYFDNSDKHQTAAEVSKDELHKLGRKVAKAKPFLNY